MKKWLLRILALLVIIIIGGFIYLKFFFGDDKRVLVFSKTEGFRHESIEAGQAAIKKLGLANDFLVEVTEDATQFTEANLKRFNVVIFLNTTGDILDIDQQIEFERFIQAGGGFVGVHSAADTEYAWNWYGKLVGAYFNGHPNAPNVREAEVELKDNGHTSSAFLPKRWKRNDEWYNYKSINPAIKILLNLDEKSYEGGTNGANHPIAWYHEYDGGRAFYTGMGHTEESFEEEQFLKHLKGGIIYAIGSGTPLNYAKAYSEPIAEENRFTKVVLDQNLNEPMELEVFEDGRILFVERRGKVRMWIPEAEATKTLATLEVFNDLEDGVLGVAKDPNYKENNWIYIYYSPVEPSMQRLSRFVLKGSKLDLESEKMILEVPTQREECCHAGGSIEFGPDGNLFLSTGDNTNPHGSDGFAPIDEQTGRSPWDAQKSSANTMDLRGKILRIKPTAEGYDIPIGNLFTDATKGRPEIYIMGCRNPFRISIDSKTKYVYWGDVGPDANDDGENRGAKGHDEVNQARQAGNFGWPYFIGDNKPYYKYDFAAKKSLAAFDPMKPVNESPNNTGAKELPPAQKAFIWYPYGDSEEFPLLGDGGRNAMAGPIYYSENYTSKNKFPDYFDGKLTVYDWMRQWIFLVSMDEKGNYEKMTPFLPSMEFNNIIDMQYGPDGQLYMIEYGTGWFTQNPDARLVRIEYNAGNRPPVAKAESNIFAGATPLEIQFSGINSVDYDGDELTFEWDFGNGEKSTEPSPKVTYTENGDYEVTLTVKDKEGLTSTHKIPVTAGNEPPKLAWSFNAGNSTFYWDDPIDLGYTIQVTDKEDGTIGNGITNEGVAISVDYLPQGLDMTIMEQNHLTRSEAAQASVGKALMADSDCASCHKKVGKSIGPSYIDIAKKYKKNPNAATYLGGKIKNGGSGVWGETAMAAHPNLTTAQAEQMAKFILSLDQEKTASLPTKGTLKLKDHIGKAPTGMYILNASYTDKGGKNAGSFTARQTTILRSANVLATTYSKTNDGMKFKVPAKDNPISDEEVEIVICKGSTFLAFEDIDLTNIKKIKTNIGLIVAMTEGGKFEVRIGGPNGDLIGEAAIEQPTMAKGLYDYTADLKPTKGIHDLYICFKNEDPSAAVGAAAYFEFIK